jgi:hypothetical protein
MKLKLPNFKQLFSTLVVFTLFLFTNIAQAQVTTNGGSGLAATYSDLASAITALNAATITSPVEITLTGSETSPAGGYSILATGTATNTILIKGTGATITAPTTHVVGSLIDGFFKIIGGDYITIEGFTLTENAANTVTAAATNTMTEFGIALFYASVTNGAQYNTILNNTITLKRIYQNSFGIYSTTRHSSTIITTTADASSAAGSNSFNKVYGNNISNVNYGTVFVGSGALTASVAMDNGNDIGGTSLTTGNTYTNWGGIGVVPSGYVGLTGSDYCVFLNNNYNDNVSNNTITSFAAASGITMGGILKNYSTGATVQPTGTFTNTISNNSVTITNNPTVATAGSIVGISNSGLTPYLATATMNITNNTVKNCVLGGTISTTNGITAIANSSIAGIINMNNNTVFNVAITATTATTGLIAAVVNSGAGGTVNLNSNTVYGLSSSSTTTGQLQGVINSGAAINAININNNILGTTTNPYVTRTAANSGGTFGILSSAGTAATCNTIIQNNEITGVNYTVAHTGTNTFIGQTGTVLIISLIIYL